MKINIEKILYFLGYAKSVYEILSIAINKNNDCNFESIKDVLMMLWGRSKKEFPFYESVEDLGNNEESTISDEYIESLNYLYDYISATCDCITALDDKTFSPASVAWIFKDLNRLICLLEKEGEKYVSSEKL